MSTSSIAGQERAYSVKVGLVECTVRCRSAKDAVRLAREELGRQMPQMWDTIQGLEDREFHVDPAG